MSGFSFSQSKGLRLFGFAGLYVAQGIPIGLLTIAMPAWLVQQGLEAPAIAGFTFAIGLPWAFKLVAGPFMDRFTFLPMGRRRPWVMVAQFGLTVSFLGFLLVDDPIAQFELLIVLGVLINGLAALQDVAVDGMAIEVLHENERGKANAFMAAGQVGGYAGFGALSGFLLVYQGLAFTAIVASLTVAVIFVFIALTREHPEERLLPWTDGVARPRSNERGPSFFGVFRDLVRVLLLPMSLLLIAVEFIARAGSGMSLTIFPLLAVDELGYASEQYSSMNGLLSGVAAVIGLAFGLLIDKFGAKKLLMVGIGGSGLTVLVFALITDSWGEDAFVVAVFAVFQVFGQALFVAMIALFMSICWTKVAATQFAVYMSLANLGRSAGAGLYGLLSGHVDLVGALLIMAGLQLIAVALLALFDPVRHRQRIDALSEPDPSGLVAK